MLKLMVYFLASYQRVQNLTVKIEVFFFLCLYVKTKVMEEKLNTFHSPSAVLSHHSLCFCTLLLSDHLLSILEIYSEACWVSVNGNRCFYTAAQSCLTPFDCLCLPLLGFAKLFETGLFSCCLGTKRLPPGLGCYFRLPLLYPSRFSNKREEKACLRAGFPTTLLHFLSDGPDWVPPNYSFWLVYFCHFLVSSSTCAPPSDS